MKFQIFCIIDLLLLLLYANGYTIYFLSIIFTEHTMNAWDLQISFHLSTSSKLLKIFMCNFLCVCLYIPVFACVCVYVWVDFCVALQIHRGKSLL